MPNPDQRHWARKEKNVAWSRYSVATFFLIPAWLRPDTKKTLIPIKSHGAETCTADPRMRGRHAVSYISRRHHLNGFVFVLSNLLLYDIDRTSGGKLSDHSKFEIHIRRFDSNLIIQILHEREGGKISIAPSQLLNLKPLHPNTWQKKPSGSERGPFFSSPTRSFNNGGIVFFRGVMIGHAESNSTTRVGLFLTIYV